jgi:hypothetical protein
MSAVDLDAYARDGWRVHADTNSAPIVARLARRKAVLLEQISAAVGIRPDRFDPADLTRIEQAKALLRALLRHDPDGRRLVLAVARAVAADFGEPAAQFYCTLSYPIVHLPEDQSERGSVHSDGHRYIDRFYTIWTPLNPCDAGPITVAPGSHKTHRRVVDKLRRVAPIAAVKPRSDALPAGITPRLALGDYLVWHGKLKHIGNLNRSGAPTVAMVTRLTDHPVMTEPTRPIADPSPIGDEPPVDGAAFARQVLAIQAEIDTAGDGSQALADRFAAAHERAACWQLEPALARRISFTLTMLAQRLLVHPNRLRYDLFALALAEDNLESLVRVRDAAPAAERPAFDDLCLSLYDSAQVRFLTGRGGRAPLLIWR